MPDSIADVDFYVLPYMKGAEVLERVARDEQPQGHPDPDRRRGELHAARARRGHPLQRRRRARRQHRRAGGRADPGQRPAPRRLRPAAARGPLGAAVRPRAGRPAGADHRLRPHRRRPSSGGWPASRSPRSPGWPAGPGPDRRRCTPSPSCDALLPDADVAIVDRPAHPGDRGSDRRRRSWPCCPTAPCWSTSPAARWSTPTRWSPRPRPGGSGPPWTSPNPSRCRPTTRSGVRRGC